MVILFQVMLYLNIHVINGGKNTAGKSLMDWLAIPTPEFLKPNLSVHCSVLGFSLPAI